MINNYKIIKNETPQFKMKLIYQEERKIKMKI